MASSYEPKPNRCHCTTCQELREDIERLRHDFGQVQGQLQRIRHVMAVYEDQYVKGSIWAKSRRPPGQEYLLYKIVEILQEGM